MNDVDAYPLCWPAGQPRTPGHRRERGTFKGTLDACRTELLDEIDRLICGKVDRNSHRGVIISTNMPLRRDGGINASASRPHDHGVAVYFQRKGENLCFACDRYDEVWKNIRAIAKTIEALRGIERWGSSEMLDRAFTGFLALPAPTKRPWREVLFVNGFEPLDVIRARYKDLAKQYHPDKGGSADMFAELADAFAQAEIELGGVPT